LKVLSRVVAVLVVVGLLATPLVLHFTQRTHDRLALDLETRFPEDRPLAGGEIFATTLADIVEHELRGSTGWRPNDFVLWGPRVLADNNANRQLGIIQAVRESARVLKDHLTKVSSDPFDANLIAADTAFRNDAEKFWLPSAENKYGEGVWHLRDYVNGLAESPPRSRPMNLRNAELIRLFQAWTDVLGDAHAALFREPESFFTSDDDFYRAQGVTHVMHHLMRAVAREYHDELEKRPILRTLFDEVTSALGAAAVLKPLVVLNGGPEGLFANHRRNLDAYVTEARQKMYSIREELEK
jgi:hypothetical protein